MIFISKNTFHLLKKKWNKLFVQYPSCDHLNNALRFLRDGNSDTAAAEIIFAIEKSGGGYWHNDVYPYVLEVKKRFFDAHRERNKGETDDCQRID